MKEGKKSPPKPFLRNLATRSYPYFTKSEIFQIRDDGTMDMAGLGWVPPLFCSTRRGGTEQRRNPANIWPNTFLPLTLCIHEFKLFLACKGYSPNLGYTVTSTYSHLEQSHILEIPAKKIIHMTPLVLQSKI